MERIVRRTARTATAKRVTRPSTSITELEARIERLTAELREARDGEQANAEMLRESLECQSAISDVLQVISRSTLNLELVLHKLLLTASRLCGGAEGALALRQGNVFRYVVTVALTPEVDAPLRARWWVPDRRSTVGRVPHAGRGVHRP